MLKVSLIGKWQLYWGNMPLPEGAEALGTIDRSTLDAGVWWKGALIRLSTGIYVQGNAGGIRTLDQKEVEVALAKSEAAGSLGSMSSNKKASSSRENGKLGGRPRKKAE